MDRKSVIKGIAAGFAVVLGCSVLGGCGPYKITLPPPDFDSPKEKASGVVLLDPVTTFQIQPKHENFFAMRTEYAPADETEYYTEENPVTYMGTSIKSCLTTAGYDVIIEPQPGKTPDLKLAVVLDGQSINTKYQANWAGIAVGLATGLNGIGGGGDTTRAAVRTSVNLQNLQTEKILVLKLGANDSSAIHWTKAGGAERSLRLTLEKYCKELLAVVANFRKLGKN